MIILLIILSLTIPLNSYTIKKSDLIKYYDTLSVDKKVSQLFIVYKNNLNFEDNIPGGIIPSINLLKAFYQKKKTYQNIKNIFDIPPFIVIDQEGGKVDRLKFISKTPSLNILFHDKKNREKSLQNMLINLKIVNVNINLSPVVDLSYTPNSLMRRQNRNIFSLSVDSVSDFYEEYISLHKKMKILNCLKHFPGYGETFDNSDFVITEYKGNENLLKKNLELFYKLFDRSDFVMLSNLIYPFIDSIPAIRSKKIISLIKEKNDRIIVLTDDIASKSQENPFFTLKESFKNGADMFILMDDTLFQKMVDSLFIWLKRDEISKEELDKKLFRIMLKKEYLFNMIKRIDQTPIKITF